MIQKVLLLLFSSTCFLFASPIVEQQNHQKAKLQVKTIYEAKINDLQASDVNPLLENSVKNLDFYLKTPVCGAVYESIIDSSGRIVKNKRFIRKVDFEYETILEDYNIETGDFKCRYVSKNHFPEDIVTVNSLPKWSSRLALLKKDSSDGLMVLKQSFLSKTNGDFITGEYWIPYVDKFVSSSWNKDIKYQDFVQSESGNSHIYNTNNFNVYSTARKLGIWVDTNTKLDEEKKDFTLSQFLINLITLNSEVVVGVDGYGDIKINKDVERRLTILHEQDGDGAGWSDLVKIKDEIFSALSDDGNQDNIARKKYTDANSFLDYFNFKLFGMYYNFMGIAWSNIFAYASMLFLSFMVLYSGAVIGVKYGVHKLDENMKGRPFEFPAKIRLISIGAVLVLSFVQFPTGEGIRVDDGEGNTKTIQAQTSIAKTTISYLGNIGTVVADISAGNSTTVYLDYLLKATNSQSYKQIKENIAEYEKEVALQAVRVSFFSGECISPYSKKKFNSEKSFQGVDSDNINDWVWNGNAESRRLFMNGADYNSVSPYLCKRIEKDIAITRKALKIQQKILEKNIANRVQGNGSSKEELSVLFAMTQLQATKTLGWINIASLPILHVFMMNSGILGSEMGLEKRGDGQIKSIILDSTLQNQYKNDKELEEEAKDYLKGGNLDGILNTGVMDEFFVWILSKQVYSMLPAFEDTRKGIQTVVRGGAETLIDILSNFPFAKPLSIAKKMMRFGFDKKSDKTATPLMALLLYIISFALAVIVYKIMLSAIFGGMVSLLIILKIVLYFVDVFAYFFVSPLIVGWKLTINDRTDRVHRYITSGFVLLMLRPTLIVFSSVMFIIAYEVMLSVYSLSFDMIFSSLEMANELYEESDIGSLIMMGAIKGFGEVMILVFGMILAYQIILNGDDMILQKFGYKDDTDNGMANQLGNKIQGIAGGKI